MFTNIKLSLTQIALLLLTGLVGILVVALRLQGSALHKTQRDLLAARLDLAVSNDLKNVADLRRAFEAADKAYQEAK